MSRAVVDDGHDALDQVAQLLLVLREAPGVPLDEVNHAFGGVVGDRQLF